MTLNDLTTVLENYQLPTPTRIWSGIGVVSDFPHPIERIHCHHSISSSALVTG